MTDTNVRACFDFGLDDGFVYGSGNLIVLEINRS